MNDTLIGLLLSDGSLQKSTDTSNVRFKTISMSQLLYYYNIFYKKNIINNIFEKIVPMELKNNFNAILLAHLIMGDGNYLNTRNIIRIYTNSYTEKDVRLLSNIIIDNLGIDTKVVFDRKDQYIIVIENINYIRDILLPYMHPSMLYKLGINENILPDSLDMVETHLDVFNRSNDSKNKFKIINNKFNYFNIINII